MTSSTSAQTTAESVSLEGKSWGMVARVVGDTVKVCDTLVAAVVVGGCMVLDEYERQLCTVDEDHPFSGALSCRVDNGETDLARRFKLSDRLEKEANEKRAAEFDDETRAQWKSRKRIISGPSGIIPAGLSNRRY